MAYTPTGMQALFPIYLGRMPSETLDREAYDASVAQNENNLNQDLELLYNKLLEIESALAEITEGENES